MPRVSIAQEFKNSDTSRFPKFKLTLGEKSRIWMPEAVNKPGMGPWMEWYHRIEAPMVEHGEPVMEVKDTRRGPIETWKMEWIGNVFCLGETGTPENPGPLMTAGIDPENCPACESASNKTGVAAPQQRFATNVIKYKVKGRGPKPYDLASPISAEVLIWAYTSRIHGSLHELESEHGELRGHDLKIELEDTPGADMYQKIKTLAIIVQPAYTDPKVREYVTDLWKTHPENRATDDQLRDACLGRDVPRLVMMDMVRRAENQYRQVEQAGTGGGDSAAADSAFNGDLSSGVDALLDSAPPADTGPADPWAGEVTQTLQNLPDPTDEDIDSMPGHPGPPGGGLTEFMGEEDKQRARAVIREGEEAIAAGGPLTSLEGLEDDPFGDETPTAGGATTTGTAAPDAESRSRTAPKSAEPAGTSEPPKANGRRKAEQPSLEPEPVKAVAGKVMDFDDLFTD